MTEHQIRVVPGTDAERFLATEQAVWFQEPSALPAEEFLLGLPADMRYAAEVDDADPGTYPGVYGIWPLALSIPGPGSGVRQVPCAGLAWVGVHPDHRRKGVLSAMMRHHLEQLRERGGHLSALHASEPAIYGRYGYGLASLELDVHLGRGTTLTAPHLDDAAATITTQLTAVTDPGMAKRMHECHLGHADLGAVVGPPDYYARLCRQLPEDLRDKEPWQVLFARRGGSDVGFAMFRRSHRWDRARPSGEIRVWGLIGEPAARLALLRRLVDFDLIGTVKLGTVGEQDHLLLWAGGPRATSDVATYDSLWVRLVDLPRALEDRAWSAPCNVVVEVEDRFAPWNAGTWRIRADERGAAAVSSADDDAEIRLSVDALGGAYLGGGNLVAQHRAGLIEERRPGAVAELWRAMRTDVAPTAAIGF